MPRTIKLERGVKDYINAFFYLTNKTIGQVETWVNLKKWSKFYINVHNIVRVANTFQNFLLIKTTQDLEQ